MKTYFVDTNLILRFLLQDNQKLSSLAKTYFQQAKLGKIKLILLPFIVLELNYVLEKVYKLKSMQITKYLTALAKTPYLEIRDREVILKTLKLAKKLNIDLADLLLYSYSQQENASVLSFDKDFKKIRKDNSE